MAARKMRLELLVLSVMCVFAGAAPSSQPSGATVSGRVTVVVADAPVPEMIVYLESTNPSARFDSPSEAEISQKGARFAPSPLIICVGQTVNFKNDETRPIEHNVFSRSPAQPFDLGLYRPPEGKRVTFDKPGIVRLFCSIHRLMDGMIYVCPTPFWARVEKDGRFTIEDVPPGTWRLKTWQPSPRYNEQDVAVKTDGAAPVTVDLELSRK
jgi:plastocyanin